VSVGGTAMPPLDTASLRRDVEALAALGPRFAGTEGEAAAREHLAAGLCGAGLEVATEEFAYLGYEPGGSSCAIVEQPNASAGRTPPAGGGAAPASLPCAGLQMTAAGAAEAEVVYVGDGVDAAAGGEGAGSIAGRIVLFRNGVPTTVAPRLAARGAAGLIALSPAPDGLITHLVATFQPTAGRSAEERVLPIPGVIVEAEAGERLLARSSRGSTRVRIEHGAS
jgi:hypothetical protein